MIDIQQCTKIELDAINARMIAWKIQVAGEQEPPAEEPVKNTETQQMEMNL